MTGYHAEFDHCWSNSTSLRAEICRKIRPLVSHLSRSLKVIKSDSDRSDTYDFLLMHLSLSIPTQNGENYQKHKYFLPLCI